MVFQNYTLQKGINTTFIAAILICLILNFDTGLFDYRRTSPIIYVSYIVCLMAISNFFISRRTWMKIQLLDILFFCYFIFTSITNNAAFSITQIGDITLLLLYICVRQIRQFDYIFIYKMILFCCFALSFMGYLQYFNIIPVPYTDYRIVGPFFNPAPYGALISIFLAIIVSVLYIAKQKAYLYISLCVIIFSIPVFILSGSRAAWIGLLSAILYITYSLYKYKIQHLPIYIRNLGVVISFVTFSLICISLYFIRPDSMKGRLFIWKISSEMALHSPIAGLGYSGFEANYMHYQAEYFKQGRGNKTERYLAGNIVSAYNEPLRILVEHGLIGLIIYVSLIVIILFRIKEYNIVFIGIKAAMIVYIIFGLFSYPNRVFSLQVIGIILFAFLLNIQKRKRYKYKISVPLKISIQSALLLIIIFFGFTVSRFHLAYNEYQSLLKKPTKDIDKDLDKLNPIISGDALCILNYCIATQGKVNTPILIDKLNNAIKLSPSNTLFRMKGDCYRWMKKYKEAEQAYWTAYYMIPSQQRAKARIVMLYLEMGRQTEAKRLAKEILKENVKIRGLNTHVLHQEMEKVIALP